jgi:hypothetical protein
METDMPTKHQLRKDFEKLHKLTNKHSPPTDT